MESVEGFPSAQHLFQCTIQITAAAASAVSDSVRPHRRQPTRLPRPWDSPGKNTRVGCQFLLQGMKGKVKVKTLSPVQLLATPWTAASQAPPSMGFSRSGVPLPSPQIPANHGFSHLPCILCHVSSSSVSSHLPSLQVNSEMITAYVDVFGGVVKLVLCWVVLAPPPAWLSSTLLSSLPKDALDSYLCLHHLPIQCLCGERIREIFIRTSLVAQLIKNPPAMWETWVLSLGWEDPPKKGKYSLAK